MTATVTPIIGGGGSGTTQEKPARKKRYRSRLPKNRRSCGTRYDDLTLVLERALYLTQALITFMSDSDPDIILAVQIRMELEDLEAVVKATTTPNTPPASAPGVSLDRRTMDCMGILVKDAPAHRLRVTSRHSAKLL